jgi:OmcA/MtrC family decaheme c-type cytochrome
LTGPDASGYYTAVLKSANAHSTSSSTGGTTGAIWKAIPAAFPAGAKLRAVQMAGNFTQRNLGAPWTGGLAIPSPSVVKAVTGEGRRSVFTMDKCRACHEAGYGNESDGGGHVTPGDFANCVTCHNPMFAVNGVTPSSSGNAYKSTGGKSTSYDPATNNTENANFPRGWNFKSLMHNAHLHANKMGNLNRCEMCHLPGTYASVPANALPTTTKITKSYTVNAVTGLNDTAGSVNLDTDLIVSPYASACLSCHQTDAAAAHAKVNGALVNQARSLGGGAVVGGLTTFVSGEACITCHGVGKSSDVVRIHAEISGD